MNCISAPVEKDDESTIHTNWDIEDTLDGRNLANHLERFKPCKEWYIHHINWLAS